MKIFLDSTDVEAIRKAYDNGLLDGVTTNPSYIAKTGRKFTDVVKEICSIVPGHVSVEVMAENVRGMIKEAQELKISVTHGPEISRLLLNCIREAKRY